ncbi:MAG: sorting protein, partial [Verrucomicrobiaceae bacterium]|nr:sorting protein [Verrucomicrobiaceae bacterium]
GILLVNNTTGSGTGSGAVAATGGILGGSGTIAGDTTISATGLLTPGTSGTADTLTFDGSLSLAAAGSATTRAILDVSAATGNELIYALTNGETWWSSYTGPLLTGNGGMGKDLVKLTGLSGTPILNFGTNSQVAFNVATPVTWQYGDVLNLFDWSNLVTVTGTTFSPGSHLDLNGLGTLDAGLTWDTSRFLTTGAIAITPEPGRVLLLLLGFLGLAFRRRRTTAFRG